MRLPALKGRDVGDLLGRLDGKPGRLLQGGYELQDVLSRVHGGLVHREHQLRSMRLAGVNQPDEHPGAVEGLVRKAQRPRQLGRTPNEHLAFGLGGYRCFCSAFARLVAQIAIGTLVRRLPGIQIDPQPAERWERAQPSSSPLDRLPAAQQRQIRYCVEHVPGYRDYPEVRELLKRKPAPQLGVRWDPWGFGGGRRLVSLPVVWDVDAAVAA